MILFSEFSLLLLLNIMTWKKFRLYSDYYGIKDRFEVQNFSESNQINRSSILPHAANAWNKLFMKGYSWVCLLKFYIARTEFFGICAHLFLFWQHQTINSTTKQLTAKLQGPVTFTAYKSISPPCQVWTQYLIFCSSCHFTFALAMLFILSGFYITISLRVQCTTV